MIGKEIYKIWAPKDVKWVDWVRPVPFVAIDDLVLQEVYNFTIPHLNYLNELLKDTAIIVDLSSYDSIKDGVALCKLGYRPIPIFNGTNEQYGVMATTNNHIIEPALIWGASILKKQALAVDAPPVFLLDTDRLNRFKMNASVFDNSWDIYPQDIPTANYFKKNYITKIIVRSDSVIQKDLQKILYKFQKENIKIFFTNGYEKPKQVTLKKTKEVS